MKKFMTTALLAAAMTSCCNNKCDKNECTDTCTTATETAAAAKTEIPAGVVKAIECYINGGRKASSEVAKPGFAETATMSWSENGKL